MPLVKREVSPVRLAARPSCWGTADSGEEVTLRGEYDLTAVTNVTLCGALRQLASLVTAAQDVSQELQEELGKISNRSSSLAARLAALEGRVAAHNPRAVPVPVGKGVGKEGGRAGGNRYWGRVVVVVVVDCAFNDFLDSMTQTRAQLIGVIMGGSRVMSEGRSDSVIADV
ncbi:Wiskott-Aldrich syndrome protein family member 2 [Portunus trituberculatus]|uniref:Wiskott-Aldrich syndrome protein family member 2 n=1 Tax=Portunus trituberculatus TaxID=210409 RepID=A0A5B7DKG7_PORTR|nr:Wiskott-Aldrich syndrome protein family member 2 [Portunus trituberculatus]